MFVINHFSNYLLFFIDTTTTYSNEHDQVKFLSLPVAMNAASYFMLII